MQSIHFEEAMERLLAEDPRYRRNAYLFIREGLDYTVKNLHKPQRGPQRHVTGRELLDGLRLFALEQYGPLAKTVLNKWGIRTTLDMGEIVFSLVRLGVLGKTEEDSIEDFSEGYDFDTVFRRPFEPRSWHCHPAPAVPL